MVCSCCPDEHKIKFDSRLLEQIEQKHNDKVEYALKKRKDLAIAVDPSGASLLHYAAESGNEDMTKFLIVSGSEVNLQNNDGNTPLLLATNKQHTGAIRVLLESNADIYMCDNDEKSAIEMALKSSPINIEIAKLFLQQVSKECTSDSTEIAKKLMKIECPLHVAVLLQKVDVTTCMLAKGCSIDARDLISGKSALHFAVENSDLEHVERLVFLGADVNAKDSSGKLPLAMLHDFSKPEEALNMLKTLINAKTKLNSSYKNVFLQLRSILQNGTKEAVKLTLETYLRNSQATDENKQNVIHYVAKNCNPRIVEIIENKTDLKNIDVNDRDKNGLTALHCAMSVGNVNFVKYLIKEGANMNIMDNNGVSSFLQALNSTEESTLEKRIECVKVLLMNKAYPDIFMGHYFNIHNKQLAIDRDYPLLEPVIAMLAVCKALDKPFNQEILQKINSYPNLKEYFDLCASELDRMKKAKVYKKVTLFSVVVENEEFKSVEKSTFFRSKTAGDKIRHLSEKYNSIAIYKELLENYVCSKNWSSMSYCGLIISRIIFTIPFIVLYALVAFLLTMAVYSICFFKILDGLMFGISAILLCVLSTFSYRKILKEYF